MDSYKEDKLGMFLKCELFLTNNAATLAVNPDIATKLAALTAHINSIVDADSTATRNITGFTATKAQVRTEFETLILTIAAACRGYYTTNADLAKKELVTLALSFIQTRRDSELIVIADQVSDVAELIDDQLTPWGVTAAMVGDLQDQSELYRSWLQKPRTEQIKSETAGASVDTLFGTTTTLLNDTDDHLAVYQYTNASLYQEWQLCRAIDNSGGGSSSDGYTVQNYSVPAGGVINFFSGTLNAGTGIYISVTGGTGAIICATDGATDMCTTGFVAQPAQVYKTTLGEMGIDLSKTKLQFTNNGTQAITVRAGFETDSIPT